MVATLTYLGSYTAKITAITLAATSVEHMAHSLPTTPDRVFTRTIGSAAGASGETSKIAITAYSATTVSFGILGLQTCNGEAYIEVAHSLTR